MWRVSGLLVLLLAASVHAESALLSGSLGRWLDDEAAPELAELLSRHPRFRGETVGFVPMRDGVAAVDRNRLTWAVEQRLTQRLLRVEGVRLAWRSEADGCTPPPRIPYLLGVEVSRNGLREHRLHIAMVDVEEGVWVSGVSLDWTGRLSAAERAALGDLVSGGRPGTAENPLPLGDSQRISEVMSVGLRCALPSGLDGPLFVERPADTRLASVTQSLAQHVSVTPLAAVTVDRDQAAWLMALESRPLDGARRELVLTLRDGSGHGSAQQVASVVVFDGSATDASPYAAPAASTGHGPATLLTDLALYDSDPVGICDSSRARANTCVEVGFELLRPAYLIVLSTQHQRLHSQACGAGLRLAQPGQRRFRLRVPPTGNAGARPDAGLYVLAVEKRSVAHRLARHINQGPGACSGNGSGQALQAWLEELAALLQRHAPELDWRVAQLSHGSGGIVRI